MRKILIAEDDFYIRDLYIRAFKKAEYEVDTAIDGNEALQKVKDQTYDMILLDIMLPKVSGVDVLVSLKDEESPAKNTPVFIITNLGQDDVIKRAFKIGADGYILKVEHTPKQVVEEVDAFLGGGGKKDAENGEENSEKEGE
jgi:DNA-binding response OmpR family regulator